MQEGSTIVTAPGDDNEQPASNLGPLMLRTGANIGGPPGIRRRVTGLKLAYVNAGTTLGTLDVKLRGDGNAFVTEAQLVATSDGSAPSTDSDTVRVRPSSGQLGLEGRRTQVQILRTGGTSVNKVAVYDLEALVRVSRARE